MTGLMGQVKRLFIIPELEVVGARCLIKKKKKKCYCSYIEEREGLGNNGKIETASVVNSVDVTPALHVLRFCHFPRSLFCNN